METDSVKIIARIHTDFPDKFGIPRQSGLIEELAGEIVFEPEFRSPEAVRGLEDFSHIWLVWQFSLAKRDKFSPTVRPPRLGGNKRVGVFATRSPFRPNPIGLSCVKLGGIRIDSQLGPVITVFGADLVDGTPIYDIKPYLPFADCYPDASGGFTDSNGWRQLCVVIPEDMKKKIPVNKLAALEKVLSLDPRPAYQDDENRIYGFSFAGMEIKFSVGGDTLTVREVRRV